MHSLAAPQHAASEMALSSLNRLVRQVPKRWNRALEHNIARLDMFHPSIAKWSGAFEAMSMMLWLIAMHLSSSQHLPTYTVRAHHIHISV